jgi:YidC/Oxa1 family membrane protein insertase
MGDNKNFIIAIALSVAIILGWQFFYAQPMLEKQRRQQEAAQQQAAQQQAATPQPGVQPSTVIPTPQPAPDTQVTTGLAESREAIIARTPRIAIDTSSLIGSINLKGAQLDDLKLKKFRETVDPRSPAIVLLSPSGASDGYFAEHGFAGAAGASVKLPGPQTVWSAPAGAALRTGSPVTLTWRNGEGLTFRRTIAVDGDYMFTIRQEVMNAGTEVVSLFPYGRVQRQAVPTLTGVYVIHEGLIGVLDDSLEEIKYAAAKEDEAPVEKTSTGGWLGITDKYWAVAAIPDQTRAIKGAFRHIPDGTRDYYQADYLTQEPLVVKPGDTAAYETRLFAGAKVVNVVNSYDAKLGINRFDLLIDWGWFYFLTKPLFWLIDIIQAAVGNFGVAILSVTVLVKLVFFPLAYKSYVSMSQMKKLQPELQKLKERFPDDRARQQKEMMEIYKREKVSPLAGCVPIVLQIPVFFALYKVLFVTIEMRHAPFYGWIKDLSAPDPTSLFNLFGLIPWTPPSFLMIGVLPLIMGITMWVQMKLNPTPPDPVQAQIFNLMPIIFTFILAPFPAGLVLYWAWNNFLGIVQQWTIMHRMGVEVDLFGNIRSSLPSFKKPKSS